LASKPWQFGVFWLRVICAKPEVGAMKSAFEVDAELLQRRLKTVNLLTAFSTFPSNQYPKVQPPNLMP
jgi:hypothetical protein